MSAVDDIRAIVCNDLDREFVESLSTTIAWEYSRLYDALATDTSLPEDYKRELFARRRGEAATKAMADSATRLGVPFDFRRLECNGQEKILVKAGRVILIQETMNSLYDSPQPAEYKRQLANSHAVIRQLELDLGDQPNRITDWSGSVLGVVLHGCRGSRFNRDERSLGGLMLGVPDDRYTHWAIRVDLLDLALFGSEAPQPEAHIDQHQQDEVNVTLKRKGGALGEVR